MLDLSFPKIISGRIDGAVQSGFRGRSLAARKVVQGGSTIRSAQPDIRLTVLCGDLSFHHDLSLKTFEVPKDRGNCQRSSIAPKAEEAVFAHDVAID